MNKYSFSTYPTDADSDFAERDTEVRLSNGGERLQFPNCRRIDSRRNDSAEGRNDSAEGRNDSAEGRNDSAEGRNDCGSRVGAEIRIL
jgi:hypothetical protein